MSNQFSRLRETFLDNREPQQALFCTYGLDTQFFEAEILPAVFPQRLGLDREAGSAAGYLNAADRALQSVPVTVFFDHLLGDGNQLQYVAQRVAVPGAFHVKLIVLDYGDVIRTVISSANLTRPAWTQLLELFVVADLIPTEPHAWAPGLRRFLARLATEAPEARRQELQALTERLSSASPTDAAERVLSSWDAPLLATVLEGLPPIDRVDVVTPFLEGEDGDGVLRELGSVTKKGRLYLAAAETGDRYLVRGPADKIDALLDTGRWDLFRVHQEWEGDDKEATLRTLHGKALGFVSGRNARVMIGSANVTRAALQVPPPAGNVELVVVTDVDVNSARDVLPQASAITRDEVDIVPPDEATDDDDFFELGAERWVESALYWAAASELELQLIDGAPSIAVRYDGHSLGTANDRSVRFALQVRGPLYIEVDDGERAGIVPMIVADPAQFVPRGTPSNIDLDTFCLLLAGARDIEPIPGDLPIERAGGPPVEPGGLGYRGAIPWRRLLAAMQGLRSELLREAPFPRGVEFVLKNDTRMGGLLKRLREVHAAGHLLDADFAYALHELLRVLCQVEGAMDDIPESRGRVTVAREALKIELADMTRTFDGPVAEQLRILRQEIAV